MPLLLVGRGMAGIGAAGLTAISRVILFDSRNIGDSAWQSAMLTIMYAVGYSVGYVLSIYTTMIWADNGL
jgi:MFS family permease